MSRSAHLPINVGAVVCSSAVPPRSAVGGHTWAWNWGGSWGKKSRAVRPRGPTTTGRPTDQLPLATFVSGNQKDRPPVRIEAEQDADRSGAQLFMLWCRLPSTLSTVGLPGPGPYSVSSWRLRRACREDRTVYELGLSLAPSPIAAAPAVINASCGSPDQSRCSYGCNADCTHRAQLRSAVRRVSHCCRWRPRPPRRSRLPCERGAPGRRHRSCARASGTWRGRPPPAPGRSPPRR